MNPVRTLTATTLAALAVATAGIAGADAATDRTTRATGPTVVHDERFGDVDAAVTAVSTGDGRTVVTLHLANLPAFTAGTTVGAHVHTGACGAAPGASGPHYVNPTAPAGTALHDKEIWLDVDVNAAGSGRATTIADWLIAPGDARSVVVHANPTDHSTGAAGARLLCTDVDFGFPS
jgi:Cu-Zn family superoxide dismutase